MAKKEQTNKCCICGRKFKGWGNNPYGALNEKYEPIEWKENDVCCKECDDTYVLTGRIYLYTQAVKERNNKKVEDVK